MAGINLNVGASPIWVKDGWYKLDHKIKINSDFEISGDANNISLNDNSVNTIFCSHMIEHVPHTKLEKILLEFNRVLKKDSILRIQVPDLRKIATAYVNKDVEFFDKAKKEDESIRTDLGIGGMFMNFIVSPGQDTALFNRDLTEFIAGYAHIYAYDFEMIEKILELTGFHKVKHKKFLESELNDFSEPLHVLNMPPVWNALNKEFYESNNLKHYYDSEQGKYVINFKLTGFDSCPEHSLTVEAKKLETIDQNNYCSLNSSNQNYNSYAWSLLKDPGFVGKYDKMKNS